MSTASSFAFGDRDRRKPPVVEIGPLFDKQPPHAIEAEMALLGSLILDWRVVGDVLQILKGADDFYKPAHAAVFETLVELYDQSQSIDMVQLNQRLIDKQLLEDVGGLEYLVALVDGVPSATEAPRYARIVRDKAVLRRLIETAGAVLHECYHSDEPVFELLDRAETQIFEIAEKKGDDSASDIGVLLKETFERLERDDGRSITGHETGFFELDEMTNGLQPGEMVVIAARPSMGKAQPLDAQVLTPRGYVRMGDLAVGDEVASVDGRPSRVAGVFPQGRRQVYRVTLADGRSAECCDEHLWRVHGRHWDTPRVISTGELRQLLERRRYERRVWVEPFAGRYGEDRPEVAALDPWLVGLLLGDGSLSGSSVRFSSAEAPVVAEVRRRVADLGLVVNAAGGYDYRIAQPGGAQRPGVVGVHPNPVKEVLTDWGLWGRGAAEKFIPADFFDATHETRLALLAGLIDSDGWVESWGSLRFATASPELADGVVRLVRSLGGTAGKTRKRTTYTYAGRRRDGLPAYVCNLQLPDPGALPLKTGKAERLKLRRTRQRRLNVISIEPTRFTETRCIAVTHPDHLYVTDQYVVTHNTAFAVNIAEHLAATKNLPVAVFSLEMSKQQLAQRMLCSRSGVDSNRMRRNTLSREDFGRLSLCVGELSEAPLYIDDTAGLTLMSLRAKARRMKQRHDVQAVFIDYLQLMSAPSAGRDGRQNEVSAISRGVKALARELAVPVVCLSQLNRQAEQREGHRPRMSDLRESGSIEQDADVIMMLHREDYYHRGDEEYVENNVAEVIVNKQRNGPTGTVKLHFHGPTTRFHNPATSGQQASYGG